MSGWVTRISTIQVPPVLIEQTSHRRPRDSVESVREWSWTKIFMELRLRVRIAQENVEVLMHLLLASTKLIQSDPVTDPVLEH